MSLSDHIHEYKEENNLPVTERKIAITTFRKVSSGSIYGLEAKRVFVEVILTAGNSEMITISGLPDSVVRESTTRVRAAINLSNLSFPRDTIVINLSPADIKKEGCFYDLAFAAGIISPLYDISQDALEDTMIIGELSLNGMILPLKGVLPMVITAKKTGYRKILLPAANFKEASIVRGIEVIPISHLQELIPFLRGEYENPWRSPAPVLKKRTYRDDFADVVGQNHGKRAMEIAAAGRHNILLTGPPGSGKSMLASRLPTIMPEMTEDEKLTVTEIYSVAGLPGPDRGLITDRPFRAPHHSISYAGLVGGGTCPRPGEISLANHGVLFLDELLEFKRSVLEVLRQPLEKKTVTISRAAGVATFPSDFLLIAATNPCPCGNLGSRSQPCICSQKQITAYRGRLSSPLNDRIDIKVNIPAVKPFELLHRKKGEKSETIRKRIETSCEIQRSRFQKEHFHWNGEIPDGKILDCCPMDKASLKLLSRATNSLNLSARSFNKIIKLARTIADLDGQEVLRADNIGESIQFNRET